MVAKFYLLSLRSVTLSLKARLKPLAKKPPKGAMSEANMAITAPWKWIGRKETVFQETPN